MHSFVTQVSGKLRDLEKTSKAQLDLLVFLQPSVNDSFTRFRAAMFREASSAGSVIATSKFSKTPDILTVWNSALPSTRRNTTRSTRVAAITHH